MSKYLEIFFIAAFIALLWIVWNTHKQRVGDRKSEYSPKVWEQKYQAKEVELKQVEQHRQHLKKSLKEIEHNYDQTFDSIINSNDTADVARLIANLERYCFLLDSAAGQNN